MIRGLSQSVNLGIAFLQRNNLKLVCTEEEAALMPVIDGSALRARLVDEGCSSFENWRSGRIWRVTREHEISTQTWRIPWEKTNGMGKYIPVQTNHEIQGDDLVEISDKTVMGLILQEIVHNIRKKLGCIFIENLNSEPLDFQRGQMIGFVTSCIVMQEELGQRLEKRRGKYAECHRTDL